VVHINNAVIGSKILRVARIRTKILLGHNQLLCLRSFVVCYL